MRAKTITGKRRIQMLHDLANDDGYVALKWAAEDRERRRHVERMSKNCCTAEDYWILMSDDDDDDDDDGSSTNRTWHTWAVWGHGVSEVLVSLHAGIPHLVHTAESNWLHEPRCTVENEAFCVELQAHKTTVNKTLTFQQSYEQSGESDAAAAPMATTTTTTTSLRLLLQYYYYQARSQGRVGLVGRPPSPPNAARSAF